MNEHVIAKVKKLLRLAESKANEHEARQAAERASELMLRHHLTLQDMERVDDMPREPMRNASQEKKWADTEDKFLHPILETHFFVRVVTSRWRTEGRHSKTVVHFLGRESDVEVATYIYQFLFRKFRELWADYKRRTGATEGDRQAYYDGLAEGLDQQLWAARERVQSEMALVVVEDKAVGAFVAQEFPKLRRRTHRYPVRSALAQAQGRRDGRSIEITRGVAGGGQGAKRLGR